jgi:8-oxo-dGTP diphosphatase
MTAPMDAPASGMDEDKARIDHAFPKKRISAAALLRGPDGGILIVQPRYREHWLLPGGVCEADESPHAAVVREVQEELGLTISVERLLSVDYLTPADGFSEAINFLFECSPLGQQEADAIVLDCTELLRCRFADESAMRDLLVPAIMRRLDAISRAGAAYCENGMAVAALGGRVKPPSPAM